MSNSTRPSARSRALQVEGLETKILLSGVVSEVKTLAAPAEIHALSSTSATVVKPIGPTAGTYTTTNQVPDTGTTYSLHTRGRLGGVGTASVAGTLHSTGFLATGHAGGTLTLATSRGSLTLQLTGPTQPGFSPLPTHLNYQITGGTGKYRTATGSGTISLTLTPAASSTMHQGHGRVALTFA